MPRVYSPT
nr:hypothetical protein [Carrot red leaf luteovirus associated RNA]